LIGHFAQCPHPGPCGQIGFPAALVRKAEAGPASLNGPAPPIVMQAAPGHQLMVTSLARLLDPTRCLSDTAWEFSRTYFRSAEFEKISGGTRCCSPVQGQR
jgi:hypothetical protein